MAADCLIGIDVGTQSVRALLTDRHGRLRICASRPTPTLRPKPGWAEHDPEALWQAVLAVLREVAPQVPAGQTVAGIAVASLGEACVLMDAADQPLGRIVAWFDRRTEEDAHRISAERLFSVTGLARDPTYTLCKLLWTRRTMPALFARARRMLNVADWIAFRLSGEAATDFSLASRTACLTGPPLLVGGAVERPGYRHRSAAGDPAEWHRAGAGPIRCVECYGPARPARGGRWRP